jgi:hypothetical protein
MAPYNGRFLIGPHHEAWDQLIHRRRRICVLAPRDHGKTFYWDFAFPLWKAEAQPDGRGYIFSGSQEQAVRILGDIKDEVEDNPKLQHLLPTGVAKVWSATVIELKNGHRIYARGFGTKTRGAHPGWLVVDDGLNDEDAYSELVRRKKIDYFMTAISGMVGPTGQLVVVGTPFHAQDLYGELERNTEYTFARYPALDPVSGQALWPARYDVEKLAARRREIGSVRFTREYLCQPISDDMSLFPGHLFQGQPTEQTAAVLGKGARYWEQLGITRRFIGVDLAISSSTGADYTVLFVLGLDRWGNRWVLDIIREKGLGFQQQLSLVNAAGRKYDPDLIFIESNQMQRVFGDELIRTTSLPIKKFVTTGAGKVKNKQPTGNTTSANKNSLEGGVPGLRVLLENKKFRIPRGDARSVEITDQWIGEMRSFTWLDGKLQGVGAHDDTVMALWIADQAVRQGGFSFSVGDEPAAKGRPANGNGHKPAEPRESLDTFLAGQMAEPTARPDQDGDRDPVQRVLASIGTGNPLDEDDLEREDDQAPPRASGNLVDEDDDPAGVGSPDAAALRALWPHLGR